MMLLSTGTTPDGLTRSYLGPGGLPAVQTGGVPYMHPVRGAFGCAGCVRGVAGLNDFASMPTWQKLGVYALAAAGVYGGYHYFKKHRRRRR